MSTLESVRYTKVLNPCLADFPQRRYASSVKHDKSTDILTTASFADHQDIW